MTEVKYKTYDEIMEKQYNNIIEKVSLQYRDENDYNRMKVLKKVRKLLTEVSNETLNFPYYEESELEKSMKAELKAMKIVKDNQDKFLSFFIKMAKVIVSENEDKILDQAMIDAIRRIKKYKEFYILNALKGAERVILGNSEYYLKEMEKIVANNIIEEVL